MEGGDRRGTPLVDPVQARAASGCASEEVLVAVDLDLQIGREEGDPDQAGSHAEVVVDAGSLAADGLQVQAY